MFRPLLFTLILLVTSSVVEKCYAQNKQIDSLKTILKTARHDTNRVNALSALAQEIAKFNPDSTLLLEQLALEQSKRLNWMKGEAIAECNIGIEYYYRKEFEESNKHFDNAIRLGETMITSKHPLNIRAAKRVMRKTFLNMANTYRAKRNIIKTLESYTKALKLSEELQDGKWRARIMYNIGALYYDQADNSKGLEYFKSGLIIAEEIQDHVVIGAILGGIAGIYYNQSDYPNALKFNLKGLKLAEQQGNQSQISLALLNIGRIYNDQLEYKKSLDYLNRGLMVAEKNGINKRFSQILLEIAAVYRQMNDFQRALEYYFKAVKYFKEQGDKEPLGQAYSNIGAVYDDMKDYDQAIEYYMKGLKEYEESDNISSIGMIVGNIGRAYTEIGKFKEAEKYLKKSLLLNVEMGRQKYEQFTHDYLSTLYEKTNRPALALEHYKKYIALRDTIFSQENSKKLMRTEMDHEYEKKKAVADAEHKVQIENQKLVTAEKEKKQNIVIASVVAGLLLVIIFAGFIFRSLRITSKQKLIIEQKNAETEHQKKEIEEKQKEILDSIRYAKRIQMAQVPSEKRVQSMLSKVKK